MRLSEIYKEMASLPKRQDEGGHKRADELLIETIKNLTSIQNITQATARRTCQAIIAEYKSINKWFA